MKVLCNSLDISLEANIKPNDIKHSRESGKGFEKPQAILLQPDLFNF